MLFFTTIYEKLKVVYCLDKHSENQKTYTPTTHFKRQRKSCIYITISFLKHQFVLTHTIHQAEIHPLVHSRVTNTYLLPYLLTYLLTHSTEQSPSWEANRFSASQEIPHISRNPKVHYRTHKRPPPVSILGQPNPVHIPTSHLLEIYLNAYTGCPRRNVPDFGRVFLMLNYTDIAQNTCIQSWTVMEIMAREVWIFDSIYSLIDYQIHIETGRHMWFL